MVRSQRKPPWRWLAVFATRSMPISAWLRPESQVQTGGSESRPVGTVWMACVGPGERVHAERQVWDSDREGNKRLTAVRCVELVLEAAQASADD